MKDELPIRWSGHKPVNSWSTQNLSMPECLDARNSGVSEAFTGFETSAHGEFGGADLLASFEFDGLQAQERCMTAGNEPFVFYTEECTWHGGCLLDRLLRAHFLRRRFAPNVAGLTAKRGIGAGPGSEAAHAVV